MHKKMLVIEETIAISLRQRTEEAERAYDSLVRTTAEETRYWQAIARAAELMERDRCGWQEVFHALDAARKAGLTWEEQK